MLKNNSLVFTSLKNTYLNSDDTLVLDLGPFCQTLYLSTCDTSLLDPLLDQLDPGIPRSPIGQKLRIFTIFFVTLVHIQHTLH